MLNLHLHSGTEYQFHHWEAFYLKGALQSQLHYLNLPGFTELHTDRHWPRFAPLEVCPALDFSQQTAGSTPQPLNPPKTSLTWESSTNEGPVELAHRTSTSDASAGKLLLGSTHGTWMSALDFCIGKVCSFPPPKLSSLKKKELEK